jgi:DNA-binding transcriptional ArsR family regulator
MTPRDEPRWARLAAAIADPARSRMLAYLLDGHLASAGELAAAASVGASTASGHLRQLLDAGLVGVEPRGRHRYYRLADAEVAQALEALALVAERGAHERAWRAPARVRLRGARCCYGHLAGRLGVALMDRLLAQRHLTPAADGLALTAAGRDWLAALGIDVPVARAGQRLAYPCLDWSERRDHLAGVLAGALLASFIDRGWLRPLRDAAAGPALRNRALVVTPPGRQLLLPLLGAAADWER